MDVVEMLGQLGQLLNDPDEERYAPFDKLVRLNMAQRKMMSRVPVSELANLAVYNYRLQATQHFKQKLPLDFFREISPESVVSAGSGSSSSLLGNKVIWRVLPPETVPVFPFCGSFLEPVIKITSKNILAFGRPFDVDVFLTYYRWPVVMKVKDVSDGFVNSSGDIIPNPGEGGNKWQGQNVDPELSPMTHEAIIDLAYQSFLVSDSEVKEVATQND